jgi:hypothetical protein
MDGRHGERCVALPAACGFPVDGRRRFPDAERGAAAEPLRMQWSYGVVWREGTAPLASGKLELRADALRLDGMAGREPVSRDVAYDSLATVRVGRSAAERITGRPSLLLERRSGPPIAITSVSQPGVLVEIAERLALARLASPVAARR